MRSFLLLCLVGATFAQQVDYSNVELSDYIVLCDRQDPKRDECFKKSFQDMLPTLKGGVEGLGIRPIDPLEAKNLRFHFTSPLLLIQSLVIKNAKVHGFSQTKVNSVKTDFTDNEMKAMIDISIPKLFVEGFYKGEGRYTNVRTAPKGYFNVTMAGLSSVMRVGGKTVVDQDGETFMQLNKFRFTPDIKKMKVYVDGLFPDPELNRIATELINQNWEPMYKSMFEEFMKISEPFLLGIVNESFSQIPYRKMFLN